jgi:hypothetical protein
VHSSEDDEDDYGSYGEEGEGEFDEEPLTEEQIAELKKRGISAN